MISFFPSPRLREFYLSSVRSAAHALDTDEYYSCFLNCWERWTDNPRVAKITTKIVWDFREAMARPKIPNRAGMLPGAGYLPGGANNKLRALKHICRVAARHGGPLATMPEIQFLDEDEPDPRAATHEELAAIYHACSSADWPRSIPLDEKSHRARSAECEPINPGDYWRALVVLLFNVGLRHREFVLIRFADVDWDRGTLSLWSPKTKKIRKKPLNPSVIEHLQTLHAGTRRELIFGKAKSAEQRYEQWKQIQRRAGISEPLYDFQDMRSTCGTELFEQSPGAAQEMLGHASINTTRRHYAKLSRHLAELAATRKQPLPFYGGAASLPSPTIKIG